MPIAWLTPFQASGLSLSSMSLLFAFGELDGVRG